MSQAAAGGKTLRGASSSPRASPSAQAPHHPGPLLPTTPSPSPGEEGERPPVRVGREKRATFSAKAGELVVARRGRRAALGGVAGTAALRGAGVLGVDRARHLSERDIPELEKGLAVEVQTLGDFLSHG